MPGIRELNEGRHLNTFSFKRTVTLVAKKQKRRHHPFKREVNINDFRSLKRCLIIKHILL